VLSNSQEAVEALRAEEETLAKGRRAIDLVGLRARDEAIARRRNGTREGIAREPLARKEWMEGLAVSARPDLSRAKRDSARVLQPTAAVQSRIYAASEDATVKGGAVGGRPAPPLPQSSRATPAWRAKVGRG